MPYWVMGLRGRRLARSGAAISGPVGLLVHGRALPAAGRRCAMMCVQTAGQTLTAVSRRCDCDDYPGDDYPGNDGPGDG